MAEAKPIASLSSTLLARKGHAKPAMRPQGFANFGFGAPHAAPDVVDDLGWNDMGGVAPESVRPAAAPVAPPVADVAPINPGASPVSGPVEAPVVHRQQEEIARGMAPAVGVAQDGPAHSAAEPTSEPAPKKAERRRDARARDAVTTEVARVVATRAAPGTKAKAAFTLRLEAERHLKLRLAGAMAHRSSQAIVVEALDAYLDALPRVAELAREAALRPPAQPEADTPATTTKDKR